MTPYTLLFADIKLKHNTLIVFLISQDLQKNTNTVTIWTVRRSPVRLTTMAARVQHCCCNVSSAHLAQLVDYCGAHISIATAALTSPENLTRRPARERSATWSHLVSRSDCCLLHRTRRISTREHFCRGM